MDQLKTNVDDQIKLINNTIFAPIEKMLSLDEELSSKIPYEKYAIFLVIFLVVAGGGVFIFFQSRKNYLS